MVMPYKDPEKERERNRRRYEARKEYMRQYRRQWEKDNPDKVKAYRRKNLKENRIHVYARQAVAKALKKGTILKPTWCGDCGREKAVEAHHPDHKQALAVLWLCKSCHGLQHRVH